VTFTLRHLSADIVKEAAWDLPPLPVVWSARMTRCAGLFVIERDARGTWHPEIRLSIPLLRRRDWPWPQVVCGMNCRDNGTMIRRILEHELIHYKLWHAGEKDWGHTEDFRQIAAGTFGHQAITHGIGAEEA
jgi:hypothetical protein